MKYLICICLLVCLISCDKDEVVPCTDLNCDLIGEWNWTQTYGTIAGSTWTPESTGLTKRLDVSQTQLSFFENDSLVENFSYEVFETDTMFNDTTSYTFIRYNNNTRIYKLEAPTLEIIDFCCDGLDDKYEKD